MQLNGPHTEHEHASVSLKVLLLIFGVLLTGTLGYMIWDQNTAADTTDNTAPNVKQEAVTETTATEATAYDPSNIAEDYGFELTLSGSTWEEYKIVKELSTGIYGESGTVEVPSVSLWYQVPTSDPAWRSVSSAVALKGYAPRFIVNIFTLADWEKAGGDANAGSGVANLGTLLGKNNIHVFTWSSAQDYPTDSPSLTEVETVTKTFKITN